MPIIDARPLAAHGRLFCFGLGYTALALARPLMAEGWRVAGTCREPERQQALAAEGIAASLFERDRPLANMAGLLAGTTHIVHSIPPDDDGDPLLDLHGADVAKLSGLAWFAYLSTTGVYGDRGGAWVDESMPTTPTTARGHRRDAAEKGWCALWRSRGLPVHLFRLAGIYGPGRSQLDTVRAGTARRVVKSGQVFSRIHVDDIVAVLRASMARPHPGAAYNVCDDEAAPPQDVVAYACQLLGVPPPPEVAYDEAKLSPMARSFYAENKRVSNRRLKEELGVTLRYPTYRQGLAALLAQ